MQGNPESGQTLAQEEQSATQSATTLPGSKQNDEKTAVVAGVEAEAQVPLILVSESPWKHPETSVDLTLPVSHRRLAGLASPLTVFEDVINEPHNHNNKMQNGLWLSPSSQWKC